MGCSQTVALREAEHARSFAKRIDELGYSVLPKDDPALPDRIATAKSKKLTDREKFEKLGLTYRREGTGHLHSVLQRHDHRHPDR